MEPHGKVSHAAFLLGETMKFNELPLTAMFRWHNRVWTKMSGDGEILSNDYKPVRRKDAGFEIACCPMDAEIEVITDEVSLNKLNQSCCRCTHIKYDTYSRLFGSKR